MNLGGTKSVFILCIKIEIVLPDENRGYVGIWNEVGNYLIDIHEDSEKRGGEKANSQ